MKKYIVKLVDGRDGQISLEIKCNTMKKAKKIEKGLIKNKNYRYITFIDIE